MYTALSEEPRPTLLVDAADAIFTKRRKGDADTEGLRAVFNAGNRRGVTVARVEMVGKKRRLERLEVFGPKAIAGIGELPPTITDRSIVLRMRRKSKAEAVQRFRYRRVRTEAEAIAQPDWDAVPDVPDVPEAMSDRAQDMWEPLLAVADVAGGTWPARARQAAVVLSAEEEQRPTLGVQLLIDVRDPLSLTTRSTATASRPASRMPGRAISSAPTHPGHPGQAGQPASRRRPRRARPSSRSSRTTQRQLGAWTHERPRQPRRRDGVSRQQ